MVEIFKKVKKDLKETLSTTDKYIEQGFSNKINLKHTIEQVRTLLSKSE